MLKQETNCDDNQQLTTLSEAEKELNLYVPKS